MMRKVTDLDTLQKYFQDIMDRRALRNVQGILLLITSAAIWRKDKNTEIVVLRENGSKLGIALSVLISGQRYRVTYTPDIRKIEVHTMGKGQQVIDRKPFDNSNTVEDVLQFFNNL